MDYAEAMKVLEAMELDQCDKWALACANPYCSVEWDDETATLDGAFTADQLEAIAVWMRTNG